MLLYVASDDGKLSIFDVTRPNEIRRVSSWTLASGSAAGLRLQQINSRFAAAYSSKTEDDLAMLDLSKTPSEQITKQFKAVDAYAVDGDKNIVYVARSGELIIIQFDYPVTGEAEIWKQFYEAR